MRQKDSVDNDSTESSKKENGVSLLPGSNKKKDPKSTAGRASAGTHHATGTITNKRKEENVEKQLIDDDTLGPRPALMPPAAPITLLHYAKDSGNSAAPAADGNGKRQRTPAWLDRSLSPSLVPQSVNTGELSCIIEFFAAFSCSPVFNFRTFSLPALAVELVQPSAAQRAKKLCPIPEDSIVAAVHVKLLEIVRQAWGVRGTVSLSSWQSLMKAYMAAAQLPPSKASTLREEHGPPAVAGELFVRPPSVVNNPGSTDDEDHDDESACTSLVGCQTSTDTPGKSDSTAAAVSRTSSRTASSQSLLMSMTGDDSGAQERGPLPVEDAASTERHYKTTTIAISAVPSVQYPTGGYWALDPGMRVHLLFELLHDALDTFILRDAIEKAMDTHVTDQKERKNELAEVRRAAKDAAAKQRNEEIAMIIAGTDGKVAMTLEQQRRIVEEARKRAETAAHSAAAAKLKALSQDVHHPMVRREPFGVDRDGRCVFGLDSGAVALLTGQRNGLVAVVPSEYVCGDDSSAGSSNRNRKAWSATSSKQKADDGCGIVVAGGGGGGESSRSGIKEAMVTVVFEDAHAVAAALDPEGKREGPLRHAIVSSAGRLCSLDDGTVGMKQEVAAGEKKRKDRGLVGDGRVGGGDEKKDGVNVLKEGKKARTGTSSKLVEKMAKKAAIVSSSGKKASVAL